MQILRAYFSHLSEQKYHLDFFCKHLELLLQTFGPNDIFALKDKEKYALKLCRGSLLNF